MSPIIQAKSDYKRVQNVCIRRFNSSAESRAESLIKSGDLTEIRSFFITMIPFQSLDTFSRPDNLSIHCCFCNQDWWSKTDLRKDVAEVKVKMKRNLYELNEVKNEVTKLEEVK